MRRCHSFIMKEGERIGGKNDDRNRITVVKGIRLFFWGHARLSVQKNWRSLMSKDSVRFWLTLTPLSVFSLPLPESAPVRHFIDNREGLGFRDIVPVEYPAGIGGVNVLRPAANEGEIRGYGISPDSDVAPFPGARR